MPERTHSRELGERIKVLRLAQNLTLKELEAKARVSATHLSEIERGLTSPTVGAIERIARALGEEPALLVREHSGPRVAVVRRGERRAWTSQGATVHSLGTPFDGVEISTAEVDLADESVFDPGPGAGEEFLLVLAGAVELRLGDAMHVLSEGDAIHYAAGPVRTLRPQEASRVLWVSLPPFTW